MHSNDSTRPSASKAPMGAVKAGSDLRTFSPARPGAACATSGARACSPNTTAIHTSARANTGQLAV